MKVLNTTTEVTTGLALTSATIELTNNEVRFIVAANRRIAYLNDMINNSIHNNGRITNDFMDEVQGLQVKLAAIMCPRLEEVLLTISMDFINNFEPSSEIDVVATVSNGKTKNPKYAMEA